MSGHSIVEMMMTVIIFTFFLVVMTEIFSVGLKSWNILEMKSAVQQQSSISINMLTRDLILSERNAVQLGGGGTEFAVLDSAVSEDGAFKYNQKYGLPQWQTYILYYTFPRDPGDPNMALDLSLPANSGKKKKLIRKVIKHPVSDIARKLPKYWLYFNDINDAPILGEEIVGKPHILSDHIYEMALSDNNSYDNTKAVDIKFIVAKSILEDRLAYEKTSSDNKGIEKMVTKSTVILKNTK